VIATSGRCDNYIATGAINVTSYELTPYDESTDGPTLVRVHLVEEFSGDIEGKGVAEFLQARDNEGIASFVGLERVTGRIQGRSGSFVLQDQGTIKGAVVSGNWFVVPGSATGDLVGLRGEGEFLAHLGQDTNITLHSEISLEYRFESA
jgi:hypothetical protein